MTNFNVKTNVYTDIRINLPEDLVEQKNDATIASCIDYLTHQGIEIEIPIKMQNNAFHCPYL